MVALNNKEALENNSTKILKSKKECVVIYQNIKEIANKVGIDTETISGYTKQNGAVDPMSHAWCASKIDNQLYLRSNLGFWLCE
jgi:transglutaminase/protease-like cytokinesis protein 3